MIRLHYLKKLNIVSYVLILTLLIQLIFFIWAVDRGFDFTDEAFSYMGFRDPDEIDKAATYYTVIFDIFFGWASLSIMGIRIVRLCLLVACGSVFALGLLAWFKRHYSVTASDKVNLYLFMISGCFLINAFGTQAFTYNLASTLLFQLTVGVFLYSFQREPGINRRDMMLFFITGVLLFALFAVKFSNAILLVLAIVLLVIIDKRNSKAVAVYMFIMAAGALTLGLLMFGIAFPTWLIDYKNTLLSVGNNTGSSILLRYLEDYQFLRSSLISKNWMLIIAAIFLFLLNQITERKTFKIAIAILITALMAYLTYTEVFYLGGQKYYYVLLFFYLFLIFVLVTSQPLLIIAKLIQHKKQETIFMYLVIGFLLMIPLFGAAGTNNLLSIQIIWYTPFIFAALYLLLYLNNSFVLNMLLIALAINAAFQSVSGLIHYPYRTNPLQEECYALSSNVSGERVMVNKDIKNSVETAYDLIHSKTQFSEGDPVFSFSSDYGFIYLLNGKLPGWGWYNEGGTEANCRRIKNTKLDNLDRMIFILPVNYQLDSVYTACFKELNVQFPENYTKLGDVPYSIEHYDRPLSIYAPKSILKQKPSLETTANTD